jgi:hypothetical protein
MTNILSFLVRSGFVVSLWLLLSAAPSLAAVSVVALDTPGKGDALAEQLAESLERRANPRTGLSPSYDGDPGVTARHGAQIYDTGLRLLADSRYSKEIIGTFAAGIASGGEEGRPQTLAAGFAPDNGVLSWIRISGFDEPAWWDNWEWSVKTGENAWLGMGALHFFAMSKDPRALQVARDRAAFILLLQDKDGGVRIGPRGLADDFWWHRKSTENNESALAFLDALARTTSEKRYRQAADRIYEWLATEMYDRARHLFRRGAVETENGWQKDGVGDFAADTANWAPLDRMILDPRFGPSRSARLREIERMIAATVDLCGVKRNGDLVGISYSPTSRKKTVISLEWSAQFALLCQRLADEYVKIGDKDRAADFQGRYQEMLRHLLTFLKQRGKEKVAAHAVYADGGVAAGEPMWDDIIRTPQAYLSAASHLYLGFALRGIDPLRRLD